METTRLSTKGQIVLPRDLRIARGWKPGTEFTVEETREGILLKPTRPFPETTLDEVVGWLSRNGALQEGRVKRTKPVTLKEMEAGIAAEVARRHARGRY